MTSAQGTKLIKINYEISIIKIKINYDYRHYN
jgi:hypothetical protein